jgi:hypothetical protein
MRRAACRLAVTFTLVLGGGLANAQDIEPRSYSNAPIGVNFAIAGYAYTRDGVAFDAAMPITDVQLQTSNAVLGYARVLDFWGQSGKVDVVVPYTSLSGSATYAGQPLERVIHGMGDPMVRASVNLLGAPSLGLREFGTYQQDVIVGASLRISIPVGQYDPARVVNLGTNRWIFRPEVGASKAFGPWTFEAKAAAVLYTGNDDFYGGKRREQDPVYSLSAHAIHAFPSGSWASFDAIFFAGGRSTVDGVRSADLQQNWRVGVTYAVPIDRRNSVKLYASSGVSARTGNNFDLVGIAWQYRWGAGL